MSLLEEIFESAATGPGGAVGDKLISDDEPAPGAGGLDPQTGMPIKTKAIQKAKDNPGGRSVVPDSGAGDNPGNGAEQVSTEEFKPRSPWVSPFKGREDGSP